MKYLYFETEVMANKLMDLCDKNNITYVRINTPGKLFLVTILSTWENDEFLEINGYS